MAKSIEMKIQNANSIFNKNHTTMRKNVIATMATVLFVLSAFAQMSPIPVDPAVRIGKLDNGITYYIRHNEEPKGQADFYIAQKVGSILEEEDQRGLAHFLEHMCFNGTEHFPGNGVIRYCESIGVKFGQNLNAQTGLDETIYNIDNVPVAAIPSSIDSCLWILHDWADGLLLTDEDIDHERGVIHEEWRMRANATIRLLEKIMPAIYPEGDEHACPDGSNRYGQRLPIGLMSVVDNFPYKALRDYYEKWYRPDLQGIIVVGDIDVDQIEAKIRTIFGTIAKPVNPAERYEVNIPDNEKPIICLAKDKEQSTAITYIFCKHNPCPKEMRGDFNYLVYKYVMYAASMMLNARLDEMRQSAEPPFISADVADENFFFAPTKGSFTGSVVSSEANLTQAVTALYREMLRAFRNGFTDSEYERVKAQILANAEAAYNSRDKRKSIDYCQEYVDHFISNEPIASAEDEFALIKKIAEMIDAKTVGQILSQMGGQKNLVVAAMLPDKEGITYPTEAEMAAALAAVAAENIAPYVDAASDEPLMSKLPKPGRVLNSESAALGYTKYTLSNGATVYFRQTDFNSNEIVMLATSDGGTSLYPNEKGANLKVVSDLMTVGGVNKFSMSELQKVLAGRNVSVTPQVNIFSEGITSVTTPKDCETMMQLNHLFFTSLHSDRDAFESWKVRQRAALANSESNPMSVLQDSIVKTIYTHDKLAGRLSSAELEQIDYNRVMQIARERFANAADFTFIIIGAIDEATVLPLIETYIASLPSDKTHETANMSALDYKKNKHENTFRREMDVPMVSNEFFDYANIQFTLKNELSFSLALNALSVVLLEEIREKEGGTYSIGAYGDLMVNPAPRQQAIMEIFYQASPDKYEYLNQRVRDIVANFVKEGPSEENMSKGKEFMLKNYKESLRENAYWLNAMKTLLYTDVDLISDYEKVLQSITKEDARSIIEQVMNQGNHSEIIMVGVER